MESYVILFRGINVGGKNLLPMKDLLVALEASGYDKIKTYIQSGNVVLQGGRVNPGDIAKLVLDRFGFEPEVMVLTKSEFLTSIKHNPFSPDDGKLAHFYFCNQVPKFNLEKLEKFRIPSEEYKLVDKVFYLHAPEGIGRSKLVAKIESCLGVPATGRNLNTIKKLEQMLGDL
jgi:uncharacterized protein (DUF1697 family)